MQRISQLPSDFSHHRKSLTNPKSGLKPLVDPAQAVLKGDFQGSNLEIPLSASPEHGVTGVSSQKLGEMSSGVTTVVFFSPLGVGIPATQVQQRSDIHSTVGHPYLIVLG